MVEGTEYLSWPDIVRSVGLLADAMDRMRRQMDTCEPMLEEGVVWYPDTHSWAKCEMNRTLGMRSN